MLDIIISCTLCINGRISDSFTLFLFLFCFVFFYLHGFKFSSTPFIPSAMYDVVCNLKSPGRCNFTQSVRVVIRFSRLCPM